MMSAFDGFDVEYEGVFEYRYRRLPVILSILFAVLALIFGIADLTRMERYYGSSVYIGIFSLMGVGKEGTAIFLWLLIWVAVFALAYSSGLW